MKLEVNNVHYSYHEYEVLKGLSFEASGGEILGILGKNGCGKTTLMKCITAHLKPKLGSITIDGDDVSCIPRRQLAKNMAIVAQSASLNFPFTVLETVMMGRYPDSELFQDPSDEEMELISRSMKATGILNYAERSVNELSGGEKQRVLISRALVQDPKILLLDEPTLHLDLNHQFGLMELIVRLSKENGILVVIVTHDVALAARYCDRILLIDDGQITDSGPAADVITSENLEKVFKIKSIIEYSAAIDGLNVFILGKTD